MEIDWAFIGTLEGRSLVGYVPNPTGSRSGVTVAIGVDIGQWTTRQLQMSTLPESLKRILTPYIGLIGADAVSALATLPLTITDAQADLLDAEDRGTEMDALDVLYRNAAGTGFDGLPGAAQTVIASVAYQYGPSLGRRCPHFWAAAVTQDWPSMVVELRNFGDAYRTRRKAEADYLQAAIDSGNT